ncbi:hypothetical protein SAY87_002510 [Trapa incisa]|uniref:Transmembrane protein n=1 Tax=Trapa incisa TaxID=236973 RepID=A0AAN7JUT3_9MYRT|nr:hypothetical protein SAY87_002510 [Trapa incisa]
MDDRFLLLVSMVLLVEMCTFTAASRAFGISYQEAPAPSLSPATPNPDWTVTGEAEAPTMVETRRVQRHHSLSGSAGGDVILGGFVTAFVAAILWYIRVTRKTSESNAQDSYS